eukprot:Blabericola_migrator_1__8478@NODE_441_length_8449_cov_49_535552_g346_i0_p6_GENE_NODE_441_length_8449_cov_49_535552_g346_i0NODE_441_length_8449_cov_49_535552_g346_i0_p6_ORF_typecomplete_len246_score34_75PSI/PF01437_25/0_0015PSI/PF01437_25/0_4Stressantifung/PF01657_17/0_032Stressantifung/PF01657_17/1_1e02DUF4187/PF13821_6/15DUF4187/PF13821_6/0_81_NODE_441_length_8449_cov_49_535552_g346_i075418278
MTASVNERFDRRLQSFETEVRVLSYFHNRDLTRLQTSDVAVMRYFCENGLTHKDCSMCLHHMVNSQYKFCGWCNTENKCQALIDASSCSPTLTKFTRHELSFYHGFIHPSFCPTRRSHERGSFGCAANQDCRTCLRDAGCIWCGVESAEDDMDFDSWFASVAPGLTTAQDPTKTTTTSTADTFNFTAHAYVLFHEAVMNEERWEKLVNASMYMPVGQTQLSQHSVVERLQGGEFQGCCHLYGPVL